MFALGMVALLGKEFCMLSQLDLFVFCISLFVLCPNFLRNSSNLALLFSFSCFRVFIFFSSLKCLKFHSHKSRGILPYLLFGVVTLPGKELWVLSQFELNWSIWLFCIRLFVLCPNLLRSSSNLVFLFSF